MDEPLMLTIRDTYRLWSNCMKKIAAEAGVPDSYRMVLTYLLHHPGSSQKEVAEYRNITTSSVSQTVKEMTLTGYVKKEVHDRDQRYVRLFLTEKGEDCAREIRERIRHADRKISRLFTEEREQQMKELLHELSCILEEEIQS